MGKLKTQFDKLTRQKKVFKRQNSGRCYNYVIGEGYSHYTKGYKKRSVSEDSISKGYTFLFSFLDRLNDKQKTEETTNQEE